MLCTEKILLYDVPDIMLRYLDIREWLGVDLQTNKMQKSCFQAFHKNYIHYIHP